LDAARNGPKKQRQLLRKEKLADDNLFLQLTAHANGRPLKGIVTCHRRHFPDLLGVLDIDHSSPPASTPVKTNKPH